MSPITSNGVALPTAPARTDITRLAQELEATFLQEMLKSGGLGKPSESFGGGLGEDQFASFLREEQARQLSQAGGVGLAEMIVRSLAAGDGHG